MTKRQNIALILNIAALVLGCVGIIFRLSHSIEDFFLYYTQISNVIAVISSAMFIIFRRTGIVRLSAAVRSTRYLAACMLTMTFLVVMCIFVPFGTPETTRRLLGSVNGVLHHTVCPVLSVVSYIFFEDGEKTRRAPLIPFIATAIYSFTVYTLNFLRLAPAPYPFFEVYDHPVWELIAWFIGLMAMVTVIAVVVNAANRGVNRRYNKEEPHMRCPKCGSEYCQIINEVHESGKDYHAGRGCCGYLLFGWVGLLCGLCGKGRTTKNVNYWVCNNCGKKWKA